MQTLSINLKHILTKVKQLIILMNNKHEIKESKIYRSRHTFKIMVVRLKDLHLTLILVTI